MSSSVTLTEAQNDECFAPRLKELAEEISEAGGSFVALVEFKGGSETTQKLAEGAGPAARITRYAAISAGSVDSLIMAIERDVKEFGGAENSVYLRLLGGRR